MKKAILYCLRQKVFFERLLVNKYILPVKGMGLEDTSKLEVNVLGVTGSKALVLLPNVMANGEQNTALVDLEYIEE